MRFLGIFALIGGVIGLESVYNRQFGPAEAATVSSFSRQLVVPFSHAPLAAIAGLLAAALGFAAAFMLYAKADKDPLSEKLTVISQALRRNLYFDELYSAVFVRFHDLLAAIAEWFDNWLIASAAVRGVHGTTEFFGRALRLLQTGNLQTYAFLFALGVAFVLYLALK